MRRRRSLARAVTGARPPAPSETPGRALKARVGAALLALLCLWITLGQVGLLRGALGAGSEPAHSQDLVSVVLLGFFTTPLWIGLLALLRQYRAAFGPAARAVSSTLAALPPLLAALAFVLERVP